MPDSETCQSNFYALLYRENEVGQKSAEFFSTEMGPVAHFYAVSCYLLQHPVSMEYTIDALRGVRENLARHLRGEISIAAIRSETRAANNGSNRVKRRTGDPILDWQVQHWPYTVADLLSTPPTAQAYFAATNAWASAILAAIEDAQRLAQAQR